MPRENNVTHTTNTALLHGLGGKLVCGILLLSSKAAYAAECATDGSDASIAVSSSKSDGVDVWKINASGCPPWDWSKQSTPGYAGVQDWSATIPKNPIISKNPVMINKVGSSVKGIVGMTTSGVAIFNALDRDDRDAYIYEGKTMDECRGHAAQDTYHVHTLPGACCAFTETSDSEHSPFWGVMADGIPIAGPHGDDGEFPEDLDECMGHTDDTHPFYHYHTTGTLEYPYTANCLKGCVMFDFGNNMLLKRAAQDCDPADKQYDYSSLKLDWDASPVSLSTVDSCPYTYTLNESDAPSYDMEPEGNGSQNPPQGGDRPQGGNMPDGQKPQGGDRPQGNRPQGNTPQGNRPQGNRPQGNRPQGNRPQGNRPQQG